jgi:hypothetical protein
MMRPKEQQMNNPQMPPEQEAELLKNYLSGQMPAIRKQAAGCFAKLLWTPVVGSLCVVLLYALVGITDPWAFHIGGRWTPFLTWHGYGELQTKDGKRYPLYVSFFPSFHSSQLHREGLRPTGGLQGYGWLCTAPGASQRLDLSGTIFGGWRSTDGSLTAFRLLEWRTARDRLLGTAPNRGYIDLSGHWNGSQLPINQDWASPFRSGVRFDHASVTLDWSTYSDFKHVCATRPN